MSHQDLRDLFVHLDREDAASCDNTLREALQFIQQRGLDVTRVVPWLQEHGGSCDCEVILNVDGVGTGAAVSDQIAPWQEVLEHEQSWRALDGELDRTLPNSQIPIQWLTLRKPH